MSKMWKPSSVPPRASWLILAALVGCAGPTETDGEPGSGPGALPQDPRVAEGGPLAADDVGPATRDGTGHEDETRDIEGLVLGDYEHLLPWLGSHIGELHERVPGSGAVIDAVQVRSGSYVNAIRFHYYYSSWPDNLYHGEGAYWTGWYGPTNQGTLRAAFWCPETTGVVGYHAALRSNRLQGISFFCNYVDQENGPYAPQDFSPYWGGSNGGWSPSIYLVGCEVDELITSFTLRSDSTSIRGIEGLCRAKW